MRPSKAILEPMFAKGFDIWFQPNAKDLVFLNSNNIGDSQRENMRNKYGFKIYKDNSIVVVYDPKDYEKIGSMFQTLNRIAITSYPWIFYLNDDRKEVPIVYSNNSRVLNLTDWIGDINGNMSFKGSEYEVIKLGKECRLVGDCTETFQSCTKLKSVSIQSVVEPPESIERMFVGCRDLVDVDIPELYLYHVKNASKAFFNCSSLQQVDLSTLNKTCNAKDIFKGCNSIAFPFYENNIRTGDLQIWCKEQFQHTLFEPIYQGSALAIYRTNYPDEILEANAHKQNMEFERIGGSILIFNERWFSPRDKNALFNYVEIEDIKRIFPNLNTLDVDEFDDNNDMRDLSAFN